MKTENLSTLKIHKLSQAQYDRELEAGRVDENALYLTPDEGAVASNTVLYTPQTLTEEQKTQARENIGALDKNILPNITPVDAGKFLRVSTDGKWIVESITNVAEVGA